MSEKYVVVIGGANIDIGGTPYNKLISEDSNPGRISITSGGVGRNIAHNLANLGVDVKLITAVGSDPLGSELLRYCRNNGIDISHSMTADNCNSSMYLYINDESGDMQLAVSDMDVCSYITPEYIDKYKRLIDGASAVVADCNLSEETLMHLKQTCKPPIFIDPVSVNKASKIIGNLNGFYAVKPNKIEAEYLTGITINTEEDTIRAAEIILSQGVEKVFISLGSDGILAADRDNIYIASRYDADLVNTTGAGDSSTAAVVWAYFSEDRDNYLITAAEAANAAAALTIEVPEAINHNLSADKILDRMKSTNVITKIK